MAKTLKIHSLANKYIDRNELLLHAAFQILRDFMEKENPNKHIDWNFEERQAKAWREIKYLYRWWTKTRPAREDPILDPAVEMPPMMFEHCPSGGSRLIPYDRKKYAKYHKASRAQLKAEARWDKEDQENLHRLIDVRQYLWT